MPLHFLHGNILLMSLTKQCYCNNAGNSLNNYACYHCGVQRCDNCTTYHTTVYPDRVRR